jgi:hypothetical protein
MLCDFVLFYYVSSPDRFGSEVFGNIPSIVLRSNRHDMAMWLDLALLENRRIT